MTLTLHQLVFLATLQLQIRKPRENMANESHICDNNTIWGFGSGFLLIYKERLFFVTADHNLHPEDHSPDNPDGQRIGKDYNIEIITNNKGPELTTIVLPIGGFYHLTGYCFEGMDKMDDETKGKVLLKFLNGITEKHIDIEDETLPIGCRIPDLIDVCISEVKSPFPIDLLTNQVVDSEGNIIIEQGDKKISLLPEDEIKLQSDEICVVGGTVHNNLVGDIRLERVNIFNEMKYSHKYNNNLIFNVNSHFDIEDWKGLSGAPVFTQEGQPIGLLTNGPGQDGDVTVFPMHRILKIIDSMLKLERI